MKTDHVQTCVASRNDLDHGHQLRRKRDVVETNSTGDRAHELLVIGERIRMHQRHRHASDSCRTRNSTLRNGSQQQYGIFLQRTAVCTFVIYFLELKSEMWHVQRLEDLDLLPGNCGFPFMHLVHNRARRSCDDSNPLRELDNLLIQKLWLQNDTRLSIE